MVCMIYIYGCIFCILALPVLQIEQTLQIGAGPGPLHGNRYLKCLRSDSLRHKVEPFALPGVRRLICIEAGSGQVEGIITLRDVFQFLL
nr:sucrose nonfermenting 4-like protein [Physcomitrium patens]|eukprot:XP_024379712.1 sucrose nonfermenting 4-like protein [Physcomitrella patens]